MKRLFLLFLFFDRLRDVLGKRCKIDSLSFYNSYDKDSGIYNGNIHCQELTDEEMSDFEGLLEVHGNFSIEESDITNLEGIIRIKKVTGSVSISNNANLNDIQGLSNIVASANQKLIIDDPAQYDIRADSTKAFCAVVWDIYDGTTNICNDMTKVCDQ